MSTTSKEAKETNYIELVSMLFLAGVILAVILPGIGQVQEMKTQIASLNTCRDNLMKLSQALETYEKQNQGRLPERLEDLTSGKTPILTEMPKCPAATANKRPGYADPKAYEFKQGAVPRFTIRCAGNNHQELGLKKDEPYYDSLFGLKPATTGEIRTP